jgi:hypothetical protein
MTEPAPTKYDYNHFQISLRLPHWVVAKIDGIAASEYTNRASVIRRLLATSVGCKTSPATAAPDPAD